MRIKYLYHFFDKKTGPFLNISSLSLSEGKEVQEKIKSENRIFASQRFDGYIERRKELEKMVYNLFIAKGGEPGNTFPQYMVFEECKWLESWYPDPDYLKIPVTEFNMHEVSFTYGDMFPTFSDKVNDKKEYRKNVYTYEEILELIKKYGFPQDWNADGRYGPERYIEAQVWTERTLTCFSKYITN